MTAWPPLIRDAGQQRWLVWRDAIITVAMWLLFLFIFIDQSIHFWRAIVQVQAEHPGAFLEHWDFRMKPFAALVLLLVAWLLFFGWRSLENWRRVKRGPLPPALPIAIESARRGISVEILSEARNRKVATVAIDQDGRFEMN
jgi:poly-beta-1,6-N-acetyl-D-glucosamine biosynthesis protein PgaD